MNAVYDRGYSLSTPTIKDVQVPVSRITGHVRTRTHLYGNPVNQAVCFSDAPLAISLCEFADRVGSEDYHYCMEGNFKWLLVAIPVMLVAHGVPGKLIAQAERPRTTQNAPARQSNGDDDWTRAPKVLQAANSWRTGDTLPPELRRFRESETKEPNPMDSWDLIAEVNNLPLLAALVTDPGADPECREYALSQGIEVAGPNRFFGLLRPQMSTAAPKNIQPWLKEVRDRMARPHAVVDALFISNKDMSQQAAHAAIARMTSDLRRGVAWAEVYKRYSEEFSYPPDPKNGDSTKIGLFGRLVVFPDPALGSGHMATATHQVGGSQVEVDEWEGTPLPSRLWRLARFDPAHLPTLLKASVGDVVALPSELNHEYVLYQVEEVYKGDAAYDDTDGYQVLSSIIEARTGKSKSRSVSIFYQTVSEDSFREVRAQCTSSFPKEFRSALENFDKKAKTKLLLQEEFSIQKEYRFVETMVGVQTGIHSVSAVGFDENKTHAIVLVQYLVRPAGSMVVGGDTIFYLLRKTDTGWQVVSRIEPV